MMIYLIFWACSGNTDTTQIDKFTDTSAADIQEDADGDGVSFVEGDCNDEDASIYPNAPDEVGDNIDQNCDGTDGVDSDEDGLASVVSGGSDCNDADPLSTNTDVDADCDGFLTQLDCDDNDPTMPSNDADCDGFSISQGDCDDDDASIYPNAVDQEGDGIDQDCDGSDGDGQTQIPFGVSVSWLSNRISVAIAGAPSNASYRLGIAETGGNCGDLCWTGEDCYLGYSNWRYCHDLSTTGGTLYYGGDATSLDPGETVFYNDAFEPYTTFYLVDDTSGSCWVWGDQISYYQALGCVEL